MNFSFLKLILPYIVNLGLSWCKYYIIAIMQFIVACKNKCNVSMWKYFVCEQTNKAYLKIRMKS